MMESSQMVIIHVPQFARNIPEKLSTSPSLPLELVGSTCRKVYQKCTTKPDFDVDDVLSKLCASKRRLSSFEDKNLRKKLKNRVAAQNSRDKKKARMEELERTVRDLMDKNASLTEDCERLRGEVHSLKEENSTLVQKLSCYERIVEPIEPAVFINDPLQKGQGLALLMYMILLSWFLTMPNITCSKSNSWLRKSSESGMTLGIKKRGKWRPSLCMVPMKWWGRQQKTWNPVNG